MPNLPKKFESLLGSEIFSILQNTDVIDIAQLNAIIALLIKLNLPFVLTFNQASTTNVAAAELVISLTPTTSITILLPFARGPIFT